MGDSCVLANEWTLLAPPGIRLGDGNVSETSCWKYFQSQVANSVKAMLADCTLFVYSLHALVIVLKAEAKMFPHSGFEREQCRSRFADSLPSLLQLLFEYRALIGSREVL